MITACSTRSNSAATALVGSAIRQQPKTRSVHGRDTPGDYLRICTPHLAPALFVLHVNTEAVDQTAGQRLDMPARSAFG